MEVKDEKQKDGIRWNEHKEFYSEDSLCVFGIF